MKKYIFSFFLMGSIFLIRVSAQTDITEATIAIINLSQEAFTEGSNEFTGGTQSKVKLTFDKAGDSNTFSITQANTYTCDGNTGSHIAVLAYNQTNSKDYAWIQIENTGTSNITHVAFRGWYNTGYANRMLTYGYSTTTDEEDRFTVPLFMGMIPDTPLYFQGACSVGEGISETDILEVTNAKFIRLSSDPMFPSLPVNAFSGANTNVAIYGIYIWTDDQGIPSTFPLTEKDKLTMTYENSYISLSQEAAVEISDLSGRIIEKHSQIKTISLHHLPKGIYLIKSMTANGERLTEKIYR
ncbi:MAG: T9SS type A sorting domain-containing protein [Candidatus Azobacteroides sp.]|nr:T9SS type A sorting domain-containing protein [Candidatus Azobacteroides sp.]